MIGFTILNKSKPRTLLLMHGLFTSSGYWLPYLQSLREFRLIILDIDYRAVRDIDQYISQIDGIIAAEASGEVDAVISHSLGSLIASRLPEEVRRSSFEVCPVYCATRRNADDFVEEIERKIKFAMTGDEIRNLLADVDGALAMHGVSAPLGQLIYLPDADPYFSYNTGAEFKEFRGDHFDIAEAVADIGRVLAA